MSKPAFWGLMALCILALLVCLWWFVRPEEFLPQPSPAVYLLKDDGGKVALYSSKGGEPLRVYDIYTNLLPESDVLDLRDGVPVQNEAQLETLLEDYGL